MDRIRKMAEEYASRNFVKEADKLFNESFDKAKVRFAGILEKFAKDCIEHQWISLEERYPEDGEAIMLCYQTFFEGRWLTIHTTERYDKKIRLHGRLCKARKCDRLDAHPADQSVKDMEHKKIAGPATASPPKKRKTRKTGAASCRQVAGKSGGRVAEEIGKASEIYKEIYGI